MQDFTFREIEGGFYAAYGYSGDEEEVSVPNYCGKLTLIYDDLFKGHRELRKVTFPETVAGLGGFVFDGCENLKSVELPENLNEMWQYAFVRSGIESIDVPGSVRLIVPFTFKDCKSLKSAVFHSGTVEISAWAFQGCSALETVTLPSDTKIDPKAFEGCGPELKIIRSDEG